MATDKQTAGNGCVEFDILTSHCDWPVEFIIKQISSGSIEMPVFQRNYVWDIKKASRLIESLIYGLPVPEIFLFADNAEKGNYRVIDGQQRLLSIYFYLMSKFPKNVSSRLAVRKSLTTPLMLTDILKDKKAFKDFKLVLEPDNPLNNKSFFELDEELRERLEMKRSLHAVIIKQNTPDVNNQAMFEVFSRFNTGGTFLSNQEIRASVYYCPFYEMLLELNELDAWRNLLGKSTKSLHSEDVEIILRAFALYTMCDEYTPKMSTFLNTFSYRATKFKKDAIKSYQVLFMSFISACSQLDAKAFFKSNRFSKTLFEATFVAVSRVNNSDGKHLSKKIVPASLARLKEDELFNSYLQADSTSTDNTKNRIARAVELLEVE